MPLDHLLLHAIGTYDEELRVGECGRVERVGGIEVIEYPAVAVGGRHDAGLQSGEQFRHTAEFEPHRHAFPIQTVALIRDSTDASSDACVEFLFECAVIVQCVFGAAHDDDGSHVNRRVEKTDG